MKKNTFLRNAVLGAAILGLALGCQNLEEEQPLTQSDLGGGGILEETAEMKSIFDFEYVPSEDYFIVIGEDDSGSLSVFVGDKGQGKQWLRVPDKFAKKAIWGNFLDLAINSSDGTFVFAFDFNGKVAVNGGYQYKDGGWPSKAPRFNSGKSFIGSSGDQIIELFDMDYVETENKYIVTGLSESGDIDTYIGSPRDWTKVNSNPKGFQRGTFLAAAFDNDGSTSGNGNYAGLFAFLEDGTVRVHGIRSSSNNGIPTYDNGQRRIGPNGDRLLSVLSFAFIPTKGYALTGMSESGDIDSYLIVNYGSAQDMRVVKSADKYDNGAIWGDYKTAAYKPDGSFLYIYDRGSSSDINLNANEGYLFNDRGDGETLNGSGAFVSNGGLQLRHNSGGGTIRGKKLKG